MARRRFQKKKSQEIPFFRETCFTWSQIYQFYSSYPTQKSPAFSRRIFFCSKKYLRNPPPPKGRFSPNRRYLGRKNPLVSLQFSLPLGFEKQSLFQNIPRNFSMYLELIQLRANLFVSAARFETLNPSPSTAPFRFIRFDLHDIIPPFIHLALSLCRRFSHCS